MDNIQVGIRVRPPLSKTVTSSEQWETSGNSVTPKTPGSSPYYFDHVFDTSATTGTVYAKLAEPIVLGVMEGINGTIFAYGQTASGKTFTMMGAGLEHPGIIPFAVTEMFMYIQKHPEREFLIRASYLEIYNETLTDLLDPKKELKIREDNEKNFVVKGLTEEAVTTAGDIGSLIDIGESSRNYDKTNANERSSRSHTIFKITIESRLIRDEEEGDGTIKVASLSLVDLAGSERVSATGATGRQFKEGTYINLSLHVLGKVISKLSDGKTGHVPYRESKLTSILQPSIGGNSKTCIICTMSPSEIGESHSTLKFASRAKTIKNKPIVNEVLIGEEALRKQLKRTQIENEKLKRMLEQRLNDEEKEELRQQLSRTEELKTQFERRNKALEELIVKSSVSSTNSQKEKATRRQTVCPSLLSRVETEMFFEPGDFQSTAITQAPVKSVKFAATPMCPTDESFHALYNKQTFIQHLDELQASHGKVTPVIRRRARTPRARPSFLSALSLESEFEDSLEDNYREDNSLLQSERAVSQPKEDMSETQVQALHQTMASLQDKLATATQSLEDKTVQESQLVEQMCQKDVLCQSLTSAKATAEDNLVSVQALVCELEQNKKMLCMQLEDKESLIEYLQREAEMKLKENESTVSELKRELEQTRDGNESSLQEMVFVLKKEVESMKTTLEVSDKDKNRLESELKFQVQECQLLLKDNEKTSDELATAEFFELELENERDGLLKKLEDKESLIEYLQREAEMKLKENESTVSELKRELEQTRDRNESSLQEMKKEVESMKTTLEVSDKDKNRLESELKFQVQECQLLLKDNSKTSDELATAEFFELELENERDGLLKKLGDKESLIECLQREAEMKLKENESTVSELKRKLEQTRDRNESSLQEMKKEVESMKTTLEENESTVSELKRELEQTRDRNESSLQEMVFVLKKEVESMKTTLEVSDKDKNRLESELKFQVRECQLLLKDNSKTSDELATAEFFELELENERDGLLKKLGDKESLIECLQREAEMKLKENESTVSELKRELEQTRDRNESSLQEMKKEVESMKTTLEEKSKGVDYPDYKFQMQHMARMMNDDQRKHRVALSEVQDTLSAVRKENAKLTIKIQGRGAAPAPSGPLAHAPLTSGSGIVTDFLYHNLIAEYTKLKETTDKERVDNQRYQEERNIFRTKFLYMRKYCTCSSLERAKAHNDPDLK